MFHYWLMHQYFSKWSGSFKWLLITKKVPGSGMGAVHFGAVKSDIKYKVEWLKFTGWNIIWLDVEKKSKDWRNIAVPSKSQYIYSVWCSIVASLMCLMTTWIIVAERLFLIRFGKVIQFINWIQWKIISTLSSILLQL